MAPQTFTPQNFHSRNYCISKYSLSQGIIDNKTIIIENNLHFSLAATAHSHRAQAPSPPPKDQRVVSEASDESAMACGSEIALSGLCRFHPFEGVVRTNLYKFNLNQECKVSYLSKLIHIDRLGSLLT